VCFWRHYKRSAGYLRRAGEASCPYIFNRGWAYRLKGDLDRAIVDFSKAIHFDPKLEIVCRLRGSLYAHRGEFDSAVADYSKAIGINPMEADNYNGRAWAYRKRANLLRAAGR
jgi:tetratricopeptide (TPR) repeat protein